jgi:hypothetical protein
MLEDSKITYIIRELSFNGVLYSPRGRLHLLIGQHHDSWTPLKNSKII